MSELQPFSQYVDRLSAERESLQAELDSIVYPVLTLPPEITSEIFHWCLPSSPHFIQPDPSDVPLTLLAICRLWRNIALATPQLWSRVKFRLSPYATPSRNQKLCVLLKRWLSRSASHPLHLLLDGTQSVPPTSLYNTVVQHAHHIQHLELMLEHQHLVRYLDNFQGGYPLVLESLEFYAYGTGALSLAAIQAAPRLRTLVADGWTLHPFPRDLPLWSQLTRFVGHHMSQAQGWAVLTCMSSLEEFELNLDGPPDITVQAPITLLTLNRLGVFRRKGTLCNPDDVAPFLRSLTLPALKDLTFSTDDDHISHFVDFMARSSCPLARLNVDCSLSPANFAQFFAAIPRLFQLTVDIPVRCLGDVSSMLAARNGHLPALRVLAIHFQKPPLRARRHYLLLIDMVQSRSEGGAHAGITPLEVFKLQASEAHLEYLASFDALRQQGMHITFAP
ncbi:hypothetical protein C8J57DRAFT_1615917 [Mycena rebaudengoi]|nr:hypothetical protein C8J57DRAFT_1615917 [Mycena rebaudengoi]